MRTSLPGFLDRSTVRARARARALVCGLARGLARARAKTGLVAAIHDRALARVVPALHGRLIDIGCGGKPYEAMTRPYVEQHVGVDHEACRHDTSRIDLFGTAYDLPAGDAGFDCALCTAVLEHLEEPEQALRECARVLKPGGIAVYTVPFIWHVHEEPRDFFRFSEYGLRHLFEKTGFEIVRLQALSGFWVTFGQLLIYNLDRVTRGWLRWLRWIRVVSLAILVVHGVARVLDRLDRAERWTWMYLVVARRPGAAAS